MKLLAVLGTLLSIQPVFASSGDALLGAIREGDVIHVMRLVADGANVNAVDRNDYNRTALIYAVSYDFGTVSQHSEIQLEMTKTLLDAKADVNAVDDNGWTALTYAADRSEVDTVKLLILSGADSNLDRGAALSLSASRAVSRPEIVAELIASGIHVNSVDSYGMTALKIASEFGHLEVVKLLLDAGADPKIADQSNRTPLHEASSNAPQGPLSRTYVEIVKLLIHAGADVNARDKDGITPLWEANFHKNPEIAKILRDAGATKASP